MAKRGDQDPELEEFNRRQKDLADRHAVLEKLRKQGVDVSAEQDVLLEELKVFHEELSNYAQRRQVEADAGEIEILRTIYRRTWVPCLRKHGRTKGSERVLRTPLDQMNYAASERLLSEPKKFGDVEIIGDVGVGKLGVQRTGRHGRQWRGASLLQHAGAQATIAMELEVARKQLKPNVRFAGLREWRELAEHCAAVKSRFRTLLQHRDTYLFPGGLIRNCEGQLSVPALWWEGRDIRRAPLWLGEAWSASMSLVLVETT